MAQKKKRQKKSNEKSTDIALSELAELGGVCEKLSERFPGETFAGAIGQLMTANDEQIMRVRLTLAHTKSVREIYVPSVFPLRLAALCFEACFGFQDEHLFRFRSDALGERPLESSLDDEIGTLFDSVEGALPLGFILPEKGAKAVMEYDFGDGWEIKLLRLADKPVKEPTCLCFKSVGMDAIEDCGGVWGLGRFAEIYRKITAGEKLSKEEKEQLQWRHGSTRPSIAQAEKHLTGPTPEEIADRVAEVANNFAQTTCFK